MKQHIDEDLLIKLTKDLVSIETHPLIPGQETAACVYIKEFFDKEGIPCYVKEVKDGALCNVAPTILKLMGIPQPAAMTADPLI